MEEKKKQKKAEVLNDHQADQRHIKNLIDLSPYGHIGAGAPIKDAYGNVKTTRYGIEHNLFDESTVPFVKSPNNRYLYKENSNLLEEQSKIQNSQNNNSNVNNINNNMNNMSNMNSINNSINFNANSGPSFDIYQSKNLNLVKMAMELDNLENRENLNVMDNHHYYLKQKELYKQLLENNNKNYLDFLGRASSDGRDFNAKNLNNYYYDRKQVYLDLFERNKAFKTDYEYEVNIPLSNPTKNNNNIANINNIKKHNSDSSLLYNDQLFNKVAYDRKNKPFFLDDETEKLNRLKNYQDQIVRQIEDNKEKKEQEKQKKQKEDLLEDIKFRKYLEEQEVLKKEILKEKSNIKL